MIKPGLVSISFRKLSCDQILDLVGAAGLQAIEWGGDVHVPHGCLDSATTVAAKTRDRGLNIAAYGSYYRVGSGGELKFSDVLASATALGTDVIRVWAGNCGSAAADRLQRQAVINDSRRIAEQAADVGIRIAYEFHANTLTDTTDSAVQLLTEVDHPNLRCYWQPPHGFSDHDLLLSLRRIQPWLQNLHVFHWQPGCERQALADGRQRWQLLLAEAQAAMPPGATLYALLEFCRNDDPDQFRADAAILQKMLSEINP